MFVVKRIILFFFFSIVIVTPGCISKAVPDSQLEFDPAFLNLYHSLSQYDTFSFTNSSGKQKMFSITENDSIIHNEKGWFIDQAPYRLLSISFRELSQDSTVLERPNLIFVNKNPLNNTNSLCIQFSNFYYSTENILPPLIKDTLEGNDKKFTNYYQFESTLEAKNADGIKTLFVSPKTGVLGFRTKSGEVWVSK